jgi:hypothetical protein
MPDNKINFLKLDIEGAEASALKGSKELIKLSRPVNVLSLYHLPRDPGGLPAILKEVCQDYLYFIRQHKHNTFYSVLYGILIKSLMRS